MSSNLIVQNPQCEGILGQKFIGHIGYDFVVRMCIDLMDEAFIVAFSYHILGPFLSHRMNYFVFQPPHIL